MVTLGRVAADIGCDHGYVPISLVENGIVQKAIACDLREGPLLKAKENIKKANLSDSIETRLSDGLSALSVGEADRIVITGMGGELIAGILKKGMDVVLCADELLLGPQSKPGILRGFLDEEGFSFLEEDMVEEDGKYYPLIRVAPPKNDDAIGQKSLLSDTELKYGPLLIKYRHPVLLEYLGKRQRILLDNRTAASYGGSGERVRQIEADIKEIRDLIFEIGGADYDGF